jgi:hypothetical protein
MPFVIETGEEVQALVNAVIEDGEFDATPAQALRWLSSRQKKMTARTACYCKTLSLGNTVAGQDTYSLPAEIVRVLQVTVGTFPLTQARHDDFAKLAAHWEILLGEGGIVGREDSAGGAAQLRIAPTPGDALSSIAVYAAMLSPGLVIGDDATLVIPADYYDALISGAIATGSERTEARYDIAAQAEGKFDAACQELAAATTRRFRPVGQQKARVSGYW